MNTKFLSSIFVMFLFWTAEAQIKTPASSPLAKAEYTVGLTTVNLEYYRPGKKGRTIYGDLVPYDQIWRTGANKNSMVTFGDDVIINNKEVKAGTYAVFAKPGKSSWDVYFYTDTDNWGTPEEWSEEKVAAHVNVAPQQVPVVETFTMSINDVTNDSGVLEIVWDNLRVPVMFKVPTDKKVMGNINQIMAGPSAGDYYNAARYYREAGKDLNQALEWMNKSIGMGNDRFWILRQKSLIEADMGNYKAAIETAKMSLKKAEEAGNADYVKMNNDSIAEWSKK
jgi:hypothetical protein